MANHVDLMDNRSDRMESRFLKGTGMMRMEISLDPKVSASVPTAKYLALTVNLSVLDSGTALMVVYLMLTVRRLVLMENRSRKDRNTVLTESCSDRMVNRFLLGTIMMRMESSLDPKVSASVPTAKYSALMEDLSVPDTGTAKMVVYLMLLVRSVVLMENISRKEITVLTDSCSDRMASRFLLGTVMMSLETSLDPKVSPSVPTAKYSALMEDLSVLDSTTAEMVVYLMLTARWLVLMVNRSSMDSTMVLTDSCSAQMANQLDLTVHRLVQATSTTGKVHC